LIVWNTLMTKTPDLNIPTDPKCPICEQNGAILDHLRCFLLREIAVGEGWHVHSAVPPDLEQKWNREMTPRWEITVGSWEIPTEESTDDRNS